MSGPGRDASRRAYGAPQHEGSHPHPEEATYAAVSKGLDGSTDGQLVPADLGPANRHRKGAPVTLERARRGGGVCARVQAQTAIDRYFLRQQLDPTDPAINRRLFDAGQLLLRDWTLAGLEPSLTGGYRELVDGGERTDRAALREDAYRRFRAAIQAVGPIAAAEVIEVACAGNPVGRTGLEILRRGLAVLADHYQREDAHKIGGERVSPSPVCTDGGL